MQEIFVDSKPVAIGDLIGKGGEGEVFALNGRSDAVVKIYASPLRVKREEKVRAMVHGGFAAHTNFVAYPKEIVFDQRGNFLGFLMQFVSGFRPIHELYSPKSRQRYFAKADYRFIIRAALNVANAISKVHQTGCVIGDLNHSGILISQEARAALIDADSFQFRLEQKTFPCVVGVADFTPPELHGVDLATVVRTEAHDNFGLAVAIFHLLFMGRHPYAGRHKGPDLSIGEAIAQNRFAYSLARRSSTGVSPPPGAPTLDVFPPPIQDAFERAFGLNSDTRPDASEWINALTQMEASLNQCTEIKTHYYPISSDVCPWCELSSKSGGFDMFPDMSPFEVIPDISPVDMHPDTSPIPSDSPDEVEAIERAIQEILAFKFPLMAELIPESMFLKQTGSNELKAAKALKAGRVRMGTLMIACSAAGFAVFPVASLLWIGLSYLGFRHIRKGKIDMRRFRHAFDRAERALREERWAFLGRHRLQHISKLHLDLEIAASYYQGIDEDYLDELSKLKATRRECYLNKFLDRYPIRTGAIPGIGPVRTATLISFGIETAGDVNRHALLFVPDIGDVMTRNLLEWRRKLARGFRYNPNRNAQDVVDEKRVRTDFILRKAELGAKILSGSKKLLAAKSRVDALRTKAHSDQSLLLALENWLQAKTDLKLLGETPQKPAIKSMRIC